MKYFLPVLIILACCILACKSFDERLLTNKEKVDSGVKPMRVIVNYESLKTCFPNFPLMNLSPNNYDNFLEQSFNVIKNNLTFESEPDNFHLSIMVKKTIYNENVYPYVAIIFISHPLGLPFQSFSYTIDMESAIINSDGKVLKTYTTRKTNTEYAALYWGYFPNDARKTALVKTLENACNDIRTQLKNDIVTINRLTK